MKFTVYRRRLKIIENILETKRNAQGVETSRSLLSSVMKRRFSSQSDDSEGVAFTRPSNCLLFFLFLISGEYSGATNSPPRL